LIAPFLFALTAPISAVDPRIVTVGRFDRSDPTSIACEWSACEVRLLVKGDTLLVTAEDSGKDYWQIVIDGKRTQVLNLQGSLTEYNIDLGSKATHEVSLVKRTEPMVGTTRFRAFDVPGGEIFQAKRRPHLIEFVGDSITAAFGNEGASEKEHFKPETENAYLSYASLAARALDAEVRILAWSGRKMWPDNTVPEIYDRILPTRPEPQPDPKDPAPDAVVINLATNDFAPKNPDEAGWSAAYEAFVRKLRAKYPKAQIYAALGSMMSDDFPPGNLALSTARGYLNKLVARVNDPHFHFIEFETQRYADGIGSDWHPNLVTHRRMALRLVDVLERDLHWKRNRLLDESMLLRAIRARVLTQPSANPVTKTLVAAAAGTPPKTLVSAKTPAPKTKKPVAAKRRIVRRPAHARRWVRRPVKAVRRWHPVRASASSHRRWRPSPFAAKPGRSR
jgi:lysophospholipase L1-like esterase